MAGFGLKYEPRTVDVLAIMYTIGYFLVIGLVFFEDFPVSNKEIIMILLGVLTTAQIRIIDHFFNKDTANSATVSTIRAMKGQPRGDD